MTSGSVDLPARRRCAQLTRQFASGRLTNDEFEDAIPASRDAAIDEVAQFAWGFYDDFSEHRLRGGHRLSKLQRQMFARCVLFLKTELRYDHPRRAKWLWGAQAQRGPDWRVVLPSFCRTARESGQRMERAQDRRLKRTGMIDDRIWPFRCMQDYKAALKEPPYLAGD